MVPFLPHFPTSRGVDLMQCNASRWRVIYILCRRIIPPRGNLRGLQKKLYILACLRIILIGLTNIVHVNRERPTAKKMKSFLTAKWVMLRVNSVSPRQAFARIVNTLKAQPYL